MSLPLPPTPESPQAQIARIAFAGAVFAAIGATLHVYVPAFHKPTEHLHKKLDALNNGLAEHPLAKHLFKDNPLTGNSDLTQFLAINTMETPFIAGSMVALGAVMKGLGVKPQCVNNLELPEDHLKPHNR